METFSDSHFYNAAFKLLYGSYAKVVFFFNEEDSVTYELYTSGTVVDHHPDYVCEFLYVNYWDWGVTRLSEHISRVFNEIIEDNRRQFGPVNTF